jgi:hypothetical protein
MLQPLPVREARRRRSARHRLRQAAGRACYVVELDGVGLNWLIRWRYLDRDELDGAVDLREQRRIVGEAISRMIEVSSRR